MSGTTVFTLIAMLSASLACDVEVNIDCSSMNYQFQYCSVPGIDTAAEWTDVSVVEKFSHSDCEDGKSFGYHEGFVWVHEGCRAKFHVCSCRNHEVVHCSSFNYVYKECPVENASQLIYIDLKQQESNTECAGVTKFGINGSSVYVNDGCRGKFNVCY